MSLRDEPTVTRHLVCLQIWRRFLQDHEVLYGDIHGKYVRL